MSGPLHPAFKLPMAPDADFASESLSTQVHSAVVR